MDKPGQPTHLQMSEVNPAAVEAYRRIAEAMKAAKLIDKIPNDADVKWIPIAECDK